MISKYSIINGAIYFSSEGQQNGPSGDSQASNTKTYDLMIKLYFRSSSPDITYLFLFFTGKANIQMF